MIKKYVDYTRCLRCLICCAPLLLIWATFGLLCRESAVAAESSTADIVYSARYYELDSQPSHYHLWRIDADGANRTQITDGDADDYAPTWLADGQTIVFVRETAQGRTLCTVAERGGQVTELATLPDGYIGVESIAPSRDKLIYLVNTDGQSQLELFDIATQQMRKLGAGVITAWNPDSRRLYMSTWGQSKPTAQIFDLTTGDHVELPCDLRAAAWLNETTLIAETFARSDSDQPRLITLRDDGVPMDKITLPFPSDDGFPLFADNLFAIPGDPDSVIYGCHAGNSTEGERQRFYRVNVKSGELTEVAQGRELAWSADKQFFLTGAGRDLAELGRKKTVWVSPLSLVTLANGETRPLVQGLVSIAGFDWRPLIAR